MNNENKLTINFMTGEKIIMNKPTEFGEIKCEIFRERKIMTEKYILFKIGEEDAITTYNGEDLLFCMIEIVEFNDKFCVGDMYFSQRKQCESYRMEISVLKVVKRTKCYITLVKYEYDRYCRQVGDDNSDNCYTQDNGVEIRKKINNNIHGEEYCSDFGSSVFKQNLTIDDLKDYIRTREKEIYTEDNIFF